MVTRKWHALQAASVPHPVRQSPWNRTQKTAGRIELAAVLNTGPYAAEAGISPLFLPAAGVPRQRLRRGRDGWEKSGHDVTDYSSKGISPSGILNLLPMDS